MKPPKITPYAIALAGFFVFPAKAYVKMITIKLNKIGVNPEGLKMFTPFNIPWKNAATEMKIK